MTRQEHLALSRKLQSMGLLENPDTMYRAVRVKMICDAVIGLAIGFVLTAWWLS